MLKYQKDFSALTRWLKGIKYPQIGSIYTFANNHDFDQNKKGCFLTKISFKNHF